MKLVMADIRNIVDASISEAGPMQVGLAAATIVTALYRRLSVEHRAVVVRDLQEWEVARGHHEPGD